MNDPAMHKICPRCTAQVPAATVDCYCGHLFTDTSSSAPGSLTAQAEALYAHYLAARLTHARKQLQSARLDFSQNVRNNGNASRLRAAERAVDALEEQLAEQRLRAAEAKTAAEAYPLAPPAPLAETSQAFPDDAEPTTAFRRAQAERAHAVLQESTPEDPAYGDSGVAASASFSSAQAARATQIRRKAEQADHRDCPDCGAQVPASLTRCECGYSFAVGGTSALPPEFLTKEELDALRGAGSAANSPTWRRPR